ncbi:rab18, partial [Symbiodinium microadriaticum]
MPIYRRMIQQPGVVESKQKQTPQDMFLVFHDSYKPKSKLGVPHGAWLVQTRAGKVYARAVLPLRAPPCYPQELYMSPDGKYRREDVVWEMKSSVKVFGFRVRPAGAVHLVDLDLGMAEKERPLVAAMPAIAELDPDTDRSSGLEDYEIISAEAEPAPTARVILVGDSAVGKTSLVSRFLRDTLDDSYLDTISVDISWREAETLDGRPVKCQLWDCSGTPRNWPLVGVYLRNPSTMPSGVVLCYDTTRRESFENVALWLQRLLDFPPLRASRNFHLVATK